MPRHCARLAGAISTLMALMLPVLVILSAFAINLAFLQLSRTELMVATDAAARAGGRGLSAFQDIDDAMEAAQLTASLNTVNGIPLQLDLRESSGDVAFGGAEPAENSDRFEFSEIARSAIYSQAETAPAIRIQGKFTSLSLSGALPALFPTLGVMDQFDVQQSAVAMQVDRDIALILDRSGSMGVHPGFDWPSNIDPWSFNSKVAAFNAGILGFNFTFGFFFYNPGHNAITYQTFLWEEVYELGDAPMTPWEELVEAVDVFLNVLSETDQDEQVSIASYATTATLDTRLQLDYDVIRTEIATLSPSGATAIGQGISAGVPTLLDEFARPFAAKTLLVMTDGVHNNGIAPAPVARAIVAQYDVTIHTITFGDGADQVAMQEVASIGGGDHFHAATGDELKDVFEEIANNLPTIVTQ